MPTFDEMEKHAAAMLGLTQQTVGKTQARQEFFPLVDALSADCAAVKITDHNKPVAVLLSYQKYVALTAKLCMLSKNLNKPIDPDLIGSVQITSADLNAASKKIAQKFKASLKESAGNL